MSHKPVGRLPLLSPGPQLPCSYGCMKNLTEISAAKLAGSSPRNPYKGCYQFCCLVNRGMMGVNSLPKTVTRHRRGCDLNPGPTAPESSTLTTRLLRQPHWAMHKQTIQQMQTIEQTVCNYPLGERGNQWMQERHCETLENQQQPTATQHNLTATPLTTDCCLLYVYS